MLIYLLFFTVLILFTIALICYDGEILSPPTIICATFLVSIMAAIYNIGYWGFELCWNTYGVIAGGLAIFVFCGVFLRIVYIKRMVNGQSALATTDFLETGEVKANGFYVEDWKINFCILCIVVISVIYYLSVIKIVRSHYGNVGWTKSMYYFRRLVSYGESEDEIPFVIRQVYDLINSWGYVCIYFIIYNFVNSSKVQKKIIVLCMLTVLSRFLSGGRMELLKYIVAAVTLYDLFIYRKSGKSIKMNFHFVVKGCIGIGLFCAVFVFLKQVVGRIDTRTPFYYITYYTGQSIYNLNEYLQETHIRPEVWGKETFYGLNHLVGLVTGNDKYQYIMHKEFRYYHGESIGNVYTAFRAYINDFGYVGFAVLTVMFSLIMNTWYLHLKFKCARQFHDQFDFGVILYSYLMYTVYLAFYADYFYAFFSMTLVKVILAIWIGKTFFTKIDFVFGRRKHEFKIISHRASL